MQIADKNSSIETIESELYYLKLALRGRDKPKGWKHEWVVVRAANSSD